MSSPASASPRPDDAAGSHTRQPGYEYPRDAPSLAAALAALRGDGPRAARMVRAGLRRAGARLANVRRRDLALGERAPVAGGNRGAGCRSLPRPAGWSQWNIRTKRGRLLRRRETPPYDRLIVPPRAGLDRGAKTRRETANRRDRDEFPGAGGRPKTAPSTSRAARLQRASLVVAADGLRSKLRESLGLTKSKRDLGNGRSGC